MASYDRTLDVKQGFNFKKDEQKPMGFITNLKIGTEVFDRDFTVNSPMAAVTATQLKSDATATVGVLQVVGVLETAKWALGDTDSLDFEVMLSIQSKQRISSLIYASMIDVDCEIGFVVYEYDPLSKKYYAAFSNKAQAGTDDSGATAVKGQIKKEDTNLALTIQPDASSEVESPINYKAEIKVVPKPLAQILYFATSATRKVTKNWGRVGPGI